MTNLFYIFNAVLQSIPEVRTTSNLASIIPLCVIGAFGIGKELVSEYKKWKNDNYLNSRKYSKLTDMELESSSIVRSQDLKVGDLVLLKNGERVPADCVLLRAEEHVFV